MQAALETFYVKGIARSTLADVAQRAEIKLGNVYYYFKTKELLLEAVLKRHQTVLSDELAMIEAAHPQAPLERLTLFLERRLPLAKMMSTYGCPHGSISGEVRKTGAFQTDGAVDLVETYTAWLEAQFEALGADSPRTWALEVLTVIQGGIVVAQAYEDPSLLEAQLARLQDRLQHQWGQPTT